MFCVFMFITFMANVAGFYLGYITLWVAKTTGWKKTKLCVKYGANQEKVVWQNALCGGFAGVLMSYTWFITFPLIFMPAQYSRVRKFHYSLAHNIKKNLRQWAAQQTTEEQSF